jgi:ubiquitin-conjugating enzyme E2 J1
METDARGQLGGLDTTEDMRKRLAAESSSFKCPTCGKTNSEIIKECEERAQEAVGSSQEEVVIPKELNMGWKDEMEAKKQTAAAGGNSDESEAAELAEGFVQTVPPTIENVVTSPPSEIHRAPAGGPGASSANVLPTPTRTVAAPVPAVRTTVHHQPVPAMAVHQPRRAADDVVPLWVDRTIVVLVVLLIALVLKVVFSG